MATVTLNLYSGCRIIKDKNFVVDDIETYLSTLNSVTIDNFQYQRFDLKKKINLDLDQVWQTKKTSLPYGDSTVVLKWNYCKITTDNVNYYYFITGYKQVSPRTVELSLEMDTLNTFKYYYIASNSTYTLSPKTIVKREHKDRLEIMFAKRASTAEEKYAFSQLDSQNSYQNTSDETVNLLLNVSGLEDFMTTASLSVLRLTCTTVNGAYIQFKNKKYLNVSELLISSNLITIYTSGNQVSIPMNQALNNFVLVIPSNAGLIFNFKTYTGDWTLFMNDSIYLYTSVDIFDNKFKRLIDPFQEGIATTLFKKSEETLYDKFLNNQWYLSYESTGNAVQVKFYSDEPYKYYSASSFSYNLYAYDEIIPKWSNTWEVLNSRYNATTSSESFIVDGNTYSCDTYFFRARRQNNSDVVFNKVWVYKFSDPDYVYNEYDNISFITLSNIATLKVNGMWPSNETTISIPTTGGSGIAEVSKAWSELTLTDDKYIKVFAFPYCP